MDRKTRWIASGVLAAALIGGGAAVAVGSSGGDNDAPLTGSNLERATSTALRHTGGGTVIETEIGDEGAAYGVEIRKADGSVVEVNLDSSFNVIGSAADDDGPGDKDAGSGDD